MERHHSPFKENTVVTAPSESFPIPLAYKGCALYFGSLDQVKVPPHLQADFSYELNTVLTNETFARSQEGNTETGRVTVVDGDKKRNFEVVLSFFDSIRDDYYRVESILEVLD